ncbi:hypothetical protein INT44_002037 [Umbelopsis vinacea]|uniref:Uncharacterized protein n=1 Tax=Umbelopsis vinacea TaxID=44442 RepID=A0A8H7Q339_9FUNG|nr:hypothetical protein INT44_002037 [Umbelopsis vinacea]
MFSKKLLALLLLTIFSLVLVAECKVFQADDISTWDSSKLKSWLTEHNINYDSKADLPSLVKQYRDTATHYANLFGVKVDQATSKLQNSLTAQKDITGANAEYIVEEVKRQLRVLDLEGQLDYRHIQGGLNKAKKNVIKQKAATEEQWANIVTDVEAEFLDTKQTWYQKFFNNKKTSSDSAQAWLDETKAHLQKQKNLSEAQIDEVINSLRSRLGSVNDWRKESAKKDKAWFKQLQKDLQSKADLTQEQAEEVIAGLESDFAGFKTSAIEYANGAYDNGQAYLTSFVERVTTSLRESGELTQAKINEIIVAITSRFQNVNWRTMPPQQQKTYLEQLRDDISVRSEQTKDQVNNIVAIVSKTLEDYLASIKAYLSPGASQASKSASSATKNAKSSAVSATDNAKSTVVSATDNAKNSAASATDDAKNSAASATDNAKASVASATNDVQKGVHKWLRDNERSVFEKKGYAQAHIDWVENYLITKFKNARRITTDEVNSAATAIHDYLVKTADVSEKQAKATVDQIRNGLQHARDEL